MPKTKYRDKEGNPLRVININGQEFIDNRPPYCTDEDDEFKTLKALGFPLPRNERIGEPPMFQSYYRYDTTSYPFKRWFTGANAGNDEVLTLRATGKEIADAYNPDRRKRRKKELATRRHDKKV